jgi:hypothetical protein
MFLTMVLYYCDLFFVLYPSSLCFVITTFRGMALPSSSGEPDLLSPIDRANLYRWTDRGKSHPSKRCDCKTYRRWIKSKEQIAVITVALCGCETWSHTVKEERESTEGVRQQKCWREYVDLKLQNYGENYIMRNFIICNEVFFELSAMSV